MDRRTERLARFLQRWWEGERAKEDASLGWRRDRTVEQLASELRRDLRFELNQSTFLSRRPDEGAARAAVASLVPAPSPQDADLLVWVLVRAGERARRVRATTGVGAVVTVFALVLRNVLRGR